MYICIVVLIIFNLVMNGSIGYICNDSINIKQCDIFGPDETSDYICENNKPCYIDCFSSNCSNDVMVGVVEEFN